MSETGIGDLSRNVVATLNGELYPPTRRFVRIFSHIALYHIGGQLIHPLRRNLAPPATIVGKVEIDWITQIEIGAIVPLPLRWFRLLVLNLPRIRGVDGWLFTCGGLCSEGRGRDHP